MISLGQASNYSLGQVFGHLFACGTRKSSAQLQDALAGRYRVNPANVALYHTGRSALAVAIKAVAKDKPAHVLIPGLTCIAVVRAVKAAGCTPVFVDIKPDDLSYNYEKLEQKLQELSAENPKNLPKPQKTIDKNEKVWYNGNIVLVQNTLGITWDIEKIQKLAQKYHARIVEDLAHSAGRKYPNGAEVGTIGAAAALSFGKGKAIDTISGGAVILRNTLFYYPESTATSITFDPSGRIPLPQRSQKPLTTYVTPKFLQPPTKRPKLSDRLRDRWYPFFGLLSRTFGKLGPAGLGFLVKIHFVQRSADAELDTTRRLTHWQAKLALKQLDNLPNHPLRDFRLVENRTQTLATLRQNGYNFSEIWYDTPVSPQRYEKEADFPAAECHDTVKISQQIINFPTWYRPEKLQKAYEIVKKNEVKW